MFKKLACIAVVSVLVVGCKNSCDDAVDKLKECGLASGSVEGNDNCEGAAECAADCMKDASCADLEAALIGGESNSVASCLSGCI